MKLGYPCLNYTLNCVNSTFRLKSYAAQTIIEAVKVANKYRDQKIGSWMFDQAISYAKEHDVSIIQLTTNKKGSQAKHFYENLSFETTHEGIKLYLKESDDCE